MNWLNLGGALVEISKVSFIVNGFDEEKKVFSVRFHFTANEFLESKFADQKTANDFYNRVARILGDEETDMGNPPKD